MTVDVSHPRRSRERTATLALFAVTVIWGMTFVWMKQAVDADKAAVGRDLGATTVALFLLLRFGIATLVVLAFVPSARRGFDAAAWKGGVWIGGLLLVGFLLQMLGLEAVSPAVSAFLTSLYVVFTALISAALERKRPGLALILGAALATFGGAFIGGPPQLSFGVGEWLTVGCAFVFALHILATDRLTKRAAPMAVTSIAFAVVTVGALGALWVATRRDPATLGELAALARHDDFMIPTVCSSLLATALAISWMNIYQRELDPVRAAILYALEPVWAAAISIAQGREQLHAWLWIGGGSLLLGNLVAELVPALQRRTARAASAS